MSAGHTLAQLRYVAWSYHCGVGLSGYRVFLSETHVSLDLPVVLRDRHPRWHSAAEGHSERAGEVKAPACHVCRVAPNG